MSRAAAHHRVDIGHLVLDERFGVSAEQLRAALQDELARHLAASPPGTARIDIGALHIELPADSSPADLARHVARAALRGARPPEKP